MYQIHPIAEIFPRMPGEEFVALKKDIRENGLLESIWLFEGKVLDGRHRYFACQETGSEATYREYKGSDPVGFTISLNLKRRHLDSGQRAMIAHSLERMNHGGDRKSENQDANLHVDRQQAAEMLNVSPRSVATAAMVEREAPEEVSQAVKAGAMSLNLAAQVAELPKYDQEIIATAPIEEIKSVAVEAVRNHRALGTGENEWYTPEEYAELARIVMGGIDLDPASCEEANKVINASEFYTKDDDGLSKTWNGRVWLNPPYSRDLMPAFCEKLRTSFEDGSVSQAVLVSHNNTDTGWFHNLAGIASAICFPKRRIKFYRGEEIAAPTNGQAFFYLGSEVDKFTITFRDVGFVVVPV